MAGFLRVIRATRPVTLGDSSSLANSMGLIQKRRDTNWSQPLAVEATCGKRLGSVSALASRQEAAYYHPGEWWSTDP